jgi:hypothetical protein
LILFTLNFLGFIIPLSDFGFSKKSIANFQKNKYEFFTGEQIRRFIYFTPFLILFSLILCFFNGSNFFFNFSITFSLAILILIKLPILNYASKNESAKIFLIELIQPLILLFLIILVLNNFDFNLTNIAIIYLLSSLLTILIIFKNFNFKLFYINLLKRKKIFSIYKEFFKDFYLSIDEIIFSLWLLIPLIIFNLLGDIENSVFYNLTLRLLNILNIIISSILLLNYNSIKNNLINTNKLIVKVILTFLFFIFIFFIEIKTNFSFKIINIINFTKINILNNIRELISENSILILFFSIYLIYNYLSFLTLIKKINFFRFIINLSMLMTLLFLMTIIPNLNYIYEMQFFIILIASISLLICIVKNEKK